MPCCGNNGIGKRDFLFAGSIAEELIANGASPVCNIAGLRASGCIGCGFQHGMTRCRNHLTGCEKRVANGAIGIACVAVLCASCGARIAKLSRRMFAQLGGINKLDVINARFLALIAVLLGIAECKGYVLLAIEGGNFNFCMTGLVPTIIVFKRTRIPNLCPCLAAVQGSFQRQGDCTIKQVISAKGVVKLQRRLDAGQIDRRRDQKLVLLRRVRPILIFIDDQRNLCAAHIAESTLLPCIAAGAERFHAPAARREGAVLKIVLKDHTRRVGRDLKGGRNGMRSRYISKGVGLHRADADAVHKDIFNGKADHRRNSEGLILPLRDVDSAARCDNTALTCCRGDLCLSRNIGVDTGCFELDVVNRSNAAVISGGSGVVPSKNDVAHAQLCRKRHKGTVSNDIAGERILQRILCVPNGRPRCAAVRGGFEREGEFAALHAVVRISIVEFQIGILRTGKVNARGDKTFILRCFTCGNIGVLRFIQIIIAVPTPCFAAADDTPSLRREGRILKVLFKEYLGRFGNLFELGKQIVVLVNVFQRIALGRCNLSAVHTDSHELIALVSLKGKGLVLSRADTDRAVRRDDAALCRFHLYGVTALRRSGLEANFNCVVNADRLKGIIVDCAEIRAVNDHARNLIAFIWNCGEGFGCALSDKRSALGRDRTVITRRGGYGDIVFRAILIDAHIIKGILRTAGISRVNKGKAYIIAALITVRDDNLCLRSRPVGVETGIMQVPNGLPCCAVVLGNIDMDIEMRILHAEGVARLKVKDHMRRRGLTGKVVCRRIEPFVLVVEIVGVNRRHSVFVAVPCIRSAGLRINTPALGQPRVVKVLGIQHHIVGYFDLCIVIGVALCAQIVGLGVAGVVMDNDADRLTVAGNVDILKDSGLPCLQLTDAGDGKFLIVLCIGQNNG